MPRLEIRKDATTERIYFRPSEGRPSSTPTVAIRETGSDLVASSTDNVTQDTVNTTVATASSASAKQLELADVSGIETYQTHPPGARGMYLVTNSSGQKEWVRVKSVSSGDSTVDVTEPLAFAYDTAATFVSTMFYYTVQAAQTANLKELLIARATYTVDSIVYVMDVPFDVVLIPLHNPLTAEFVHRKHPGLPAGEHASTYGSDFWDLRQAAWDRVCQGIRDACPGAKLGEAWRPAMVRSPGDLEQWALAEFDYIVQKEGIDVLKGVEPLEAIEHLKLERTETKNAALATLRFMDINEDESMSGDEAAPDAGPTFRR